MLIRPAAKHDLADIAALHMANWRQDYAGMVPDEALGQPVVAEMAARWSALAPSDKLVLVATTDAGALMGFGCVLLQHPKGPLLDNLHVAASARGQGVGGRLMSEIARRLTALGCSSLWLKVLEDNRDTRAIYARLGGVEGTVEIDHLLGHPVRFVHVRWDDLSVLSARV